MGDNISRFQQIRQGSSEAAATLKAKFSASGNSMSKLYENAIQDVDAAKDDVSRSVGGDAGSTESTMDKLTKIVGIATALGTGAATLLPVIQTLKGGKKGSAGADAGAQASGGNPLEVLNSATKNYQTNKTSGNLTTLASAITNAKMERDSIQQTVNDKEKQIADYNSMLVNGKADYKASETKLNELAGTVIAQDDAVKQQEEKVNTLQQNLNSINQRLNDVKAGKKLNESNQSLATQKKDNAEGNVDTAETAVDQTKTQKQNEQEQQDAYIAEYVKVESEIPSLKGDLDYKKGILDQKSTATNTAKTKVDGLKAQISSDKSQKQSTSVDKSLLKDAETLLKTAKTEEAQAKKDVETAQKKLDKQNEAKQKLAEKIKVGEQTLATVDKAIADAQAQKEAALAARDAAANELKGYVDEGRIIANAEDAYESEEAKAEGDKNVTNDDLANALRQQQGVKECYFNQSEATKTIQQNIDTINKSLGEEKDSGSIRNKLAQYNKAISQAETVRDGATLDFEDASIMTKAQELGYVGNSSSLEGAENITKNDDGTFTIVSGGTEKVVDKNGKPVVKNDPEIKPDEKGGN